MPEVQKLKFELTLDDANIILLALGKMPYETVESLVVDFKGQGESQLESPEQTPVVEPVEEVESSIITD